MTHSNGNGNKNGVRITLAAMAVVIAGGAVAEYRISQSEQAVIELKKMVSAQDERMRTIENSVYGAAQASKAVDKSLDQQSAQLSTLTKEINELGRQVDRLALKVR